MSAAQRSAASDMPGAPVTITRADSPENAARLQKYLQALGAPLKMGQDASRVAASLVSTMQSIVQERPDLASASFDFKSNQGSLEVVSPDLSAADREWLQDKLNANADLLDAVAQFHDDAVAGYTLWANASGTTLTQEQSDAVARKADDLTGFLKLFSKLGADAAKGMFRDGAYYAPDGSRVGFGQDPTTAAGFLSFMRSAKTLSEGSAKWVAPDGRAYFGVLKSDIFVNDRVIPNFFPDPGNTLGVSEMA
jgi:hypothetical protein